GSLAGCETLLETEKSYAGHARERRYPRKRERAVMVVLVQVAAGPCDADLEAVADPLAPGSNPLWIGRQAGNRCRHRREVMAEGKGQGQPRAMRGEWRQRHALRDQALDALHGRKQAKQLRLAFHHHPRSALRDQGRVADELDGVAENLLGVEENDLAGYV